MDQSSEKEKNRPNFIARDELACQSTKTSSHACFTKKKSGLINIKYFGLYTLIKANFILISRTFPKKDAIEWSFWSNKDFFQRAA